MLHTRSSSLLAPVSHILDELFARNCPFIHYYNHYFNRLVGQSLSHWVLRPPPFLYLRLVTFFLNYSCRMTTSCSCAIGNVSSNHIDKLKRLFIRGHSLAANFGQIGSFLPLWNNSSTSLLNAAAFF